MEELQPAATAATLAPPPPPGNPPETPDGTLSSEESKKPSESSLGQAAIASSSSPSPPSSSSKEETVNSDTNSASTDAITGGLSSATDDGNARTSQEGAGQEKIQQLSSFKETLISDWSLAVSRVDSGRMLLERLRASLLQRANAAVEQASRMETSIQTFIGTNLESKSVSEAVYSFRMESLHHSDHCREYAEALRRDVVEGTLTNTIHNHYAVLQQIKSDGSDAQKELTMATIDHQKAMERYLRCSRDAAAAASRCQAGEMQIPSIRTELALASMKRCVEARIAEEEYKESVGRLNIATQSYRKKLSIILQSLQDMEEKRILCFRDALRKVAVYEAAYLRNLQYELDHTIKQVEHINPQEDIQEFLQRHQDLPKAETSVGLPIQPQSWVDLDRTFGDCLATGGGERGRGRSSSSTIFSKSSETSSSVSSTLLGSSAAASVARSILQKTPFTRVMQSAASFVGASTSTIGAHSSSDSTYQGHNSHNNTSSTTNVLSSKGVGEGTPCARFAHSSSHVGNSSSGSNSSHSPSPGGGRAAGTATFSLGTSSAGGGGDSQGSATRGKAGEGSSSSGSGVFTGKVLSGFSRASKGGGQSVSSRGRGEVNDSSEDDEVFVDTGDGSSSSMMGGGEEAAVKKLEREYEEILDVLWDREESRNHREENASGAGGGGEDEVRREDDHSEDERKNGEREKDNRQKGHKGRRTSLIVVDPAQCPYSEETCEKLTKILPQLKNDFSSSLKRFAFLKTLEKRRRDCMVKGHRQVYLHHMLSLRLLGEISEWLLDYADEQLDVWTGRLLLLLSMQIAASGAKSADPQMQTFSWEVYRSQQKEIQGKDKNHEKEEETSQSAVGKGTEEIVRWSLHRCLYHHRYWNRVTFWEEALTLTISEELQRQKLLEKWRTLGEEGLQQEEQKFRERNPCCGCLASFGSFMVLYGIAPEQVQSLLVSVSRSCHLDEEFASRLIEGAQRFTSAYQASRSDSTRVKTGTSHSSASSSTQMTTDVSACGGVRSQSTAASSSHPRVTSPLENKKAPAVSVLGRSDLLPARKREEDLSALKKQVESEKETKDKREVKGELDRTEGDGAGMKSSEEEREKQERKETSLAEAAAKVQDLL
ncbi:hypothetical protein CSUI_005821 [Cystoisospora suis]|uniref:F-BAR domain-containing protein n=1 Tax=Cystoisospora suis TaxID=483139 RepID=A0A2C6KW66_9APIC|nr:hypothetical protein CSUI_005821 [Cystoisospora suis]